MTKEQLKQLSDSTFFDNDQGLITPSDHRAFNNSLIDTLIAESEWIDLNVTTIGGITAVHKARLKDCGNFILLDLHLTFHFKYSTFIVSNFDFHGHSDRGNSGVFHDHLHTKLIFYVVARQDRVTIIQNADTEGTIEMTFIIPNI